MTADFSDHVDSYRDEVGASVSFSGKDVDYFAKRKASQLLDVVTRHLGDPTDLSALDIGCGVGVTDAHLVGMFGELSGIDLAADAVKVAALRNPKVSYCSYDGTTLPYDDASFDVAFTICVLHHVDQHDRGAFSAEMARVVRPGGLMVIFEHNPYNPLTRVAVSRCEFDQGVELLNRREATDLLMGAGLELVERRYMLFVPIDGSLATRVDHALRRVPLGAQHYVVGQRPR
ncbi:MAG: class I SAM-dependent methyltransferase [Aquihabitans sp.]